MNPTCFQILLGLKDGPGDAEAVVARMRELAGTKEPPIASFYRALKKTLEAGHVETAATGLDTDAKRGRPAKTYRITPSGKVALSAEARRLGRLAQLALSQRESTPK